MTTVTKQRMKAPPCAQQPTTIGSIQPQARTGIDPKLDSPLLDEVRRLGGEERMKGAHGALEAFQSALIDLVRENPQRYGASDDVASQSRVVAQLLDSVSDSFLQRTVETLRRREGYLRIWGYWIHRAVFTFVAFGILVAVALPFCVVSLMSSAPWGWLPGAVGLVVAVVLGAWILSRIRNQ